MQRLWLSGIDTTAQVQTQTETPSVKVEPIEIIDAENSFVTFLKEIGESLDILPSHFIDQITQEPIYNPVMIDAQIEHVLNRSTLKDTLKNFGAEQNNPFDRSTIIVLPENNERIKNEITRIELTEEDECERLAPYLAQLKNQIWYVKIRNEYIEKLRNISNLKKKILEANNADDKDIEKLVTELTGLIECMQTKGVLQTGDGNDVDAKEYLQKIKLFSCLLQNTSKLLAPNIIRLIQEQNSATLKFYSYLVSRSQKNKIPDLLALLENTPKMMTLPKAITHSSEAEYLSSIAIHRNILKHKVNKRSYSINVVSQINDYLVNNPQDELAIQTKENITKFISALSTNISKYTQTCIAEKKGLIDFYYDEIKRLQQQLKDDEAPIDPGLQDIPEALREQFLKEQAQERRNIVNQTKCKLVFTMHLFLEASHNTFMRDHLDDAQKEKAEQVRQEVIPLHEEIKELEEEIKTIAQSNVTQTSANQNLNSAEDFFDIMTASSVNLSDSQDSTSSINLSDSQNSVTTVALRSSFGILPDPLANAFSNAAPNPLSNPILRSMSLPSSTFPLFRHGNQLTGFRCYSLLHNLGQGRNNVENTATLDRDENRATTESERLDSVSTSSPRVSF